MSVFTLTSFGISVLNTFYESTRLLGLYQRYYGPAGGVLLQLFGSSMVWKTQLQVLTSDDPEIASRFRNANQQESNMVAIASTILAQIAITALQLDNVEKVHWTSQACFTVSLVSSIISVYYATKQHKMLGRCLHSDDIKRWIRGPLRGPPSRNTDENWSMYDAQLPSVAAVLSISAPVVLLSVAVYAFLIGLGIYQGCVWRNGLGDSSKGSSLAVFIVFIISLSSCHSLYTLSTMVAASQINDSEVRPYLEKALNPAVPAGPPINIQLGELDRAPAYSSGIGSSDTKSRNLDNETQLQAAFREAAALRRNLAAVDERVAQLLEGMGQSGRVR